MRERDSTTVTQALGVGVKVTVTMSTPALAIVGRSVLGRWQQMDLGAKKGELVKKCFRSDCTDC